MCSGHDHYCPFAVPFVSEVLPARLYVAAANRDERYVQASETAPDARHLDGALSRQSVGISC